ncbi:hypothetical protein Scep_030641 [Stephania cephalantha]|uniref:Uncharacterized protein n=1 Tax=Stephania cephalantha TaxID=152367 RepID=A0AAP0E2U7_9MAGN
MINHPLYQTKIRHFIYNPIKPFSNWFDLVSNLVMRHQSLQLHKQGKARNPYRVAAILSHWIRLEELRLINRQIIKNVLSIISSMLELDQPLLNSFVLELFEFSICNHSSNCCQGTGEHPHFIFDTP